MRRASEKRRYHSVDSQFIGNNETVWSMHKKPTCTGWTIMRILLALVVTGVAATAFIMSIYAYQSTEFHTMIHHKYLMYMEKHMDMIDSGRHMHLQHMLGDDGDGGHSARQRSVNPDMDMIEYNVPVMFQYNTTLNSTYVDFNQTTFVWWGYTFHSPIDLIGARGPRGPAGVAGPIGPRGPEGPRGLQGIAGPAGDMGSSGPPGERGERGERGPEGPPGEISLMNVTAELMESLNYTMLQGPRGLQGPQGDVGPIGVRGEPGPRGDPGIQGNVGPRGDQGPLGEQGIQGEPGNDGINCWDLDANGEPTFPLEDRNGDGQVNVNDCKGDPGPISVFGTHFDLLIDRTIGDLPHEQAITTAKLDLGSMYRIGWSIEMEAQGPSIMVSIVADMTHTLSAHTITESSSGFVYWSTSQSGDVTPVPHEFKLMISFPADGKNGNSITIMSASLEFWRIS